MKILFSSIPQFLCYSIGNMIYMPYEKIKTVMLRALQFLRDLFQKKPKPIVNTSAVIPVPLPIAAVVAPILATIEEEKKKEDDQPPAVIASVPVTQSSPSPELPPDLAPASSTSGSGTLTTETGSVDGWTVT